MLSFSLSQCTQIGETTNLAYKARERALEQYWIVNLMQMMTITMSPELNNVNQLLLTYLHHMIVLMTPR